MIVSGIPGDTHDQNDVKRGRIDQHHSDFILITRNITCLVLLATCSYRWLRLTPWTANSLQVITHTYTHTPHPHPSTHLHTTHTHTHIRRFLSLWRPGVCNSVNLLGILSLLYSFYGYKRSPQGWGPLKAYPARTCSFGGGLHRVYQTGHFIHLRLWGLRFCPHMLKVSPQEWYWTDVPP